MPGYSGTPLIRKLGFDKVVSIVVLSAPPQYKKWLGAGAPQMSSKFSNIPPRGIHWFVTSRLELEKKFIEVKKYLPKDGMLWISWPKKTSAIKKDVDENTIRDAGLRNGLVDVKVAAVSDDWSGLKFVYRLKDR